MDTKTLYQDLDLKKGDIIVFGCSYGPDSMALFHTLLKLREEKDIRLVCAHINHGKRLASEQERKDIEEYCIEHQVPFEYMKIEHYGDDNFHNEARNIRYHFFEEVIMKYQAKYLMTAHHGDDLMETILMRIARGTTLEGYSGFKKQINMGDYIIYRPFIEKTKEELLEYDEKNHIPYAIDSSNNSNVYTRNRYRKEVLPFLKKEDPNIHEKFLKFSITIQKANSYIERETTKALKKVIFHDRVLINKFLEQDDLIQQTILEDILENYYQDDLILINDHHINLLLNLIKSKKANSEVTLPNDVIATKNYNEFYLHRILEEISHYEIELNKYTKLPNGHILEEVEQEESNSNNIIRLSSKEITLPLRVRTREYGDIIALKGGGHKKLKDVFIEKKITPREREIWPIVVDSKNTIVFVPGLKKSKFDKNKTDFYDIILRYK